VSDLISKDPGVFVPVPNLNESRTDDSLLTTASEADVDPPPTIVSSNDGSDLCSPRSQDQTAEVSTGFEVSDLISEEPGVIVSVPNLNESTTDDSLLTTASGADVDPPPTIVSSSDGSDLCSPRSQDRTPEVSTGLDVSDLISEEAGVIVPIPNLNKSVTNDSLTTTTSEADVDPPATFVSSNGKRKSHYKFSPFSLFRKQGMNEDVLLRDRISKGTLARRAQIRETK
jgi:hypothetical protein